MAAHSSILAWRIPWTEEPSGLQPSPRGHKKSDTTEHRTHPLCVLYFISFMYITYIVYILYVIYPLYILYE